MMNLNQSHLMIFIVIFSMNLFMNIQSQRAFIHLEMLCWLNHGHLTYKGELCDPLPKEAQPHCDPYLVICISDRAISDTIDEKSCPIHFETTPHVNGVGEACKYSYGDNRESLNKTFKIYLTAVPEKYFIKIQVKDFEWDTDNHDLIATFSNEFSQMPSPNLISFNMEEIQMNRSEQHFLNPNASLKISMGVQCEKFLYGKDCMTECRDFHSGNFYCSRDEKKFFNPRWTGPTCQVTNCGKMKCAGGATCINSGNGANCSCNGRTATECYQNYIPCSPNPCLNNGECVSYESNVHQCKCTRGFSGDLCEKTVEWDRNGLVILIGSIIGLIVILVVIAIVFGCICVKRRTGNLQKEEIHFDRVRGDMDENHYTYISENRNSSAYGQRFYADEIQRK